MTDNKRSSQPTADADASLRGVAALRAALEPVVGEVAKSQLTSQLGERLNARFPSSGPVFQRIVQVCHDGVADGWMCNREGGGIRFGRVVKAVDGAGFSVDVVDMTDIAGPHHVHPNGEVDMIMPISTDAQFDGQGAGWLVYPPGSAHAPTVTGGRALVLYLLPHGAIQFSPPAG